MAVDKCGSRLFRHASRRTAKPSSHASSNPFTPSAINAHEVHARYVLVIAVWLLIASPLLADNPIKVPDPNAEAKVVAALRAAHAEVQTTLEGRVEAVALRSESTVDDPLLPLLWQLGSLERLDLRLSGVTRRGLAHIDAPASLRELTLNSSGSDLKFLRRLTTLETLDLPENATDDALRDLAPLVGLRSLRLGHKITDAGLAALKPLVHLEYLCSPGIGNTGLPHLRDLKELREVSRLRGVTDDGLRYMEGLTKLQTLDLTDSNVTDAGLEHLGGLRGLTELRLAGRGITDVGLATIARLPRLGGLVLRGTRVTDAGLRNLDNMTALTELDLTGTRVTDHGLRHLARVKAMEMLWLDDTAITDSGVEQLAGLASLTELSLKNTRVSDAGLAHLKGLKNLLRLDLDGTEVAGPGLAQLDALTRLRDLSLKRSKMTDAGLVHLLSLKPKSMLDIYLEKTAITLPGLGRLPERKNLNIHADVPAGPVHEAPPRRR